MFDFYALPNDFPCYQEANKIQDCYEKVEKIEAAFAANINSNKFIPYIQLHEFEALVFCGLDYLSDIYPDMQKQIGNLKAVVEHYKNNTETIDNGPDTAPSKRICKEFEGFHHYDKPKSGTFVTKKVGVGALKTKCPHFKSWIDKLEKLR